jgi:sugar transferase (PEP-CTERM/EpsH1 system associated)
VINRLAQGGTEGVIIRLVRHLNYDFFDHRICALRGFQVEWVQQEQLADKVYALGGKWRRPHFPLRGLIRVMKQYRPSIVHSRNWGSIEAILAARLAGVPVVIHSEHGYEMDMLEGLPFRRRLLRRGLYTMADAVFTVTRELRDFHARETWLAPERIRVIHNGVDSSRFSPRPETRQQMREQLGIVRGAFVLGTVGRMVPIKDQHTLLRAAELLVRRGVNVCLLLVGYGSALSELQGYASSSPELRGRALFAGLSQGVAELLNAMDVFVLASLKEGMSNTLLEAMASGLPVVATRVGGNSELVEEGRSGWLFAPGNAEQLADQLALLANDEASRRQLGAAARRRVLEQFSFDRMLEQYRNLYLEMAVHRGLVAREVA